MTSPQYRAGEAVRIELPWPPKDVSPNARGHWSKKARAVKAYRDACGWEMCARGVKPIEADAILARITFHAPDRRPRDIDNMLASIKPAIDAVAGVIGVNDSKWKITMARGEPALKRGVVAMELEVAK